MSPPSPTPSAMLSDYVEVSGAEVPSQTSVESVGEPESSEKGVHEEVMGFGKHSALEANDVSY